MVNKKLIILAAGRGTRLKPYTDNMPKCLFNIGGKTTILNRIVNFFQKDFEISIVAGFCHEKIRSLFSNTNIIINPFYSFTNSIASLWFARHLLDGDEIVMMNSDIVFEKNIYDLIVSSNKKNFVMIDSSRSDEADYKVFTYNNKITMMDKSLVQCSGEYIGICKLSSGTLCSFKNKIEEMVESGQYDEWFETALVNMIISDSIDLEYIDVAGYKWTEIDSPNDFIFAKKIVAE